MKIVAYVPIKLNNERMPNKNLRCFDDGTPMAHLVFNTLSSVEEIDEIYCYCSDPTIKDYLTGRVKFLQRDKSLDTAATKCGEVISAFLNDVDADIVVLSHVTSPFLRTDTVRKCIAAVKSGEYDSAFSASRVQEFFWQDNMPLNFDSTDTPRSQDLPIFYKETSGCFVFTRQIFIETGRRIGYRPYICEVDKIEETDINYLEDFEIANAIYMHLL
ncbi:MAG: hypothetical protein IJP68_04780, partial [Selenomonadaceae bacterium]|nr:hypothetical protein [Selenomonadaceae bacterium]